MSSFLDLTEGNCKKENDSDEHVFACSALLFCDCFSKKKITLFRNTSLIFDHDLDLVIFRTCEWKSLSEKNDDIKKALESRCSYIQESEETIFEPQYLEASVLGAQVCFLWSVVFYFLNLILSIFRLYHSAFYPLKIWSRIQ